MTTATRRQQKLALRLIRDVDTFECYGFPCVIQYDPTDKSFPMLVDSQVIGNARSEAEARTTISTFCEELRKFTNAVTADMKAEKAEQEAAPSKTLGTCEHSGCFAAATHQTGDDANAQWLCDNHAPIAPPRTVDELRGELGAVNDAILVVERSTPTWNNLDRMRQQIVTELDEAHKHRVGVCHCGSRAVTPTTSLCPYHAAIKAVAIQQDADAYPAPPATLDEFLDQHPGDCPSVDHAALSEPVEDDFDDRPDEVLAPPFGLPEPCPSEDEEEAKCRACGSTTCVGVQNIQRCTEVRAMLMAHEPVGESFFILPDAEAGDAFDDLFISIGGVVRDLSAPEVARLLTYDSHTGGGLVVGRVTALSSPSDPCAGLRRENQELKAALTSLLDHVRECNTQDPDIDGDCPPDHPNECTRCYDVRMARAALGKDTSRE